MINFLLHLSQLGKFWQEKVNRQIISYVGLIIIGEIALLLVKFNSLPPQVPLFFSLPWGERQLASTSLLFLLPGLTIFISLINYYLAATISSSHLLFGRLLVFFSLFFSIITLISLFQIINLVI